MTGETLAITFIVIAAISFVWLALAPENPSQKDIQELKQELNKLKEELKKLDGSNVK